MSKEDIKYIMWQKIKDIENRMGRMSDEYLDYAIKEISFIQKKIEYIDRMDEKEIKEEFNSKTAQQILETINSSFPMF